MTTHAPVWDYLRSSIRAHRLAGTVDHRVGVVLDEYVGHMARCVATRQVTLSEGLAAANAAVVACGRLIPIPEDRLEAR
ncbi:MULTISPECIES: hypothetical protein [Methylobacterium]|uniref:Uncharacterized protein n=2 Tax=Methylobacterium TaxID=407 RepID=A0A679J0I7_9HYPH|nr:MULTISPECIES: hypothetical protein [Methylobacterium]GJD41866.1 hypothetical protein OICFNHDK_4350 [Methylobacterium bullatum]GJE17196.1 hypothetical protein AIGOOFII_1909 [Methylobacterium marchantiae]CAA2104567.1 hypothetical protein MBUL_02768 [Methylobacterium bullatum]